MAKTKTSFVCQDCGTSHPKWSGQCRGCGEWNSLVEETQSKVEDNRSWTTQSKTSVKPVALNEKIVEDSTLRWSTHIEELNRVLGGGLIPGSYVLLGGDPGIGKSTLLLQMAGGLAKENKKILYVSAEESVNQSALRAQRLGITSGHVLVASESSLEKVFDLVKNNKPDVLVIDSIQTMYLSEITSAPGSVAQVRECASRLMSLAKVENIAVFLIGHVTKDGHIAGPKVLEHMVDTVLSFEGDSNHQYRLLRALKNRFGATNELGVFQMHSSGLEEVDNPSELFLEERGNNLIGSAIFSAMEGSRPMLCEVQALASPSPTALPRRTSLGFDVNRVHLMVSVIGKQLDLDLAKADVFINVVGGLKLTEPSADLAVASALISSCLNEPVDANSCFMGEVGLTGEVRAASFIEDRIKEAIKLGFKYFVLPESNKKHLKNLKTPAGSHFVYIRNIGELANFLKNINKTKSSTKSRQPDLTI